MAYKTDGLGAYQVNRSEWLDRLHLFRDDSTVDLSTRSSPAAGLRETLVRLSTTTPPR
jgi:hypothetical protein